MTESSTTPNAPVVAPRRYRLTMELPVLLVLMGATLSGVILNNIILYRTCAQSLGYDKNECKAFLEPHKSNETKHIEAEVQQYAMFINTVKMVMESVVPAILSFFLGTWSDRYGRKPLIRWPLLGMFFSMVMTVVYSMLDDLGPWWFLVTSIPFSICGGYSVLFTGAYCYISDITTTENRSIRMTVLDAIISIATVLGSIASSYLVDIIGNIYLLVIVTALYACAYVFSEICIEESVTNTEQGTLSTVLDVSLVKEMFYECFKERPNNGRSQILLLVFANGLTSIISYGLLNVEYFYTRTMLHWALKEFTIYFAINTAIAFVGNFLGVGVLQNVLRISDLAFAMFSFVSALIEYLIKIFAVASWQMYFGAAISLFKGLSTPLIRSLVTKILPVQDIAKVLSLMGALDGICPLISPMFYNMLYAATVTSFPQSIYVLSAGFTVLSIGMATVVQCLTRRTASTYHVMNEE